MNRNQHSSRVGSLPRRPVHGTPPCRLSTTTFLVCILALGTFISRPLLAVDQISYNREIRPILSDNCFFCHGPDINKRKAKLRLDVREDAIEKKAFVPGKP